jgi:hypothetical protein
MIALIIFLWWLSGFVSSLIEKKIVSGKVLVKDLAPITLFGFLGILTICIIIYVRLERCDFWNKKIF